jgi:hypothetical protein
MSDHEDVDVVLQEIARRSLMSEADRKLERAANHPYRVPKHPHIPWSGWHGQSGSVIYAPALLQGYYLTGNTTYLDAAYETLDMSFGANPLSQSFVTGLGHKPVLDPLDRISLDDGVDTPVPGMPSPGFTWHLPEFREPYIGVNRAFWPPEKMVDNKYNESFPVLRRYIDSSSLIPYNEGTISEAAMYAAPLTVMNDGARPPNVDGTYEWEWKGRTSVLDQTYVPLAYVSRIDPVYITEWGGKVGQEASPAPYLNAFTPEQICAINAPSTPYWVGRLRDDLKEALCEEQIAHFDHFTLFKELPPSKVPLIPCEKIPTISAYEMKNFAPEWKAALTKGQIECMTSLQLSLLSFSFSPSSSPSSSSMPSLHPSSVPSESPSQSQMPSLQPSFRPSGNSQLCTFA